MSTPNTLPLSGKRVIILVGNDYEELELHYPKLRLMEAGAEVFIAGPEGQTVYEGKYGYPQVSDIGISDLRVEDADALVIPGGWMPDKLRRDTNVLKFVKAMADANKPIASICHGPWIDISAKIVEGVKYTSTPAIKDDLMNAGARWGDKEVVVDLKHKRISSRRPDDLPVFCRSLIALMIGNIPTPAPKSPADSNIVPSPEMPVKWPDEPPPTAD